MQSNPIRRILSKKKNANRPRGPAPHSTTHTHHKNGGAPFHSQRHSTIDLAEEEEHTPNDVEPWESLNDDVRELKIENSLKKVGNVRKKKMSKLILKDMLGKDGKNQLKQIKKKHEKTLKRKRKKIDEPVNEPAAAKAGTP